MWLPWQQEWTPVAKENHNGNKYWNMMLHSVQHWSRPNSPQSHRQTNRRKGPQIVKMILTPKWLYEPWMRKIRPINTDTDINEWMTDDPTDRQRPWLPLTTMTTSTILKQTCEPKTVQDSKHRNWLSIETIELIDVQPYCWPLFPQYSWK